MSSSSIGASKSAAGGATAIKIALQYGVVRVPLGNPVNDAEIGLHGFAVPPQV